MSYSSLPPEVNSGLIYAGPGSAPLAAAAAAWASLPADLAQPAAAVTGTVTGLSASWTGPSSVAMAGAAANFAGWLTRSSALASRMGAQAQAAATAYETARA